LRPRRAPATTIAAAAAKSGGVVHPPRRVEHPLSERLGHHQRVERPDARQLHLERHRLRPGLLFFRTICGRLLDQREELLRCETGIEPVGKVSSLLEARQLYYLHAACYAEKVTRDRIGVLVARCVVIKDDHDVGARVVGAKLRLPRRRRTARRRDDAQLRARRLHVLRTLEVKYGLTVRDAVDKLGQPVEDLGDVVEHAIHWVIVGGESGRGHRPIEAQWVRDIRAQTEAAGAAFFFKQWGGTKPKSGGRELDGRTWNEMPNASQHQDDQRAVATSVS
jgi:Protein of unknown function (DUF5131)